VTELALLVGLALCALVVVLFVAQRRRRFALWESVRFAWGQGRRTDREGRALDAWPRRLGDVDDATWADLEMDRVFAWADRTLTALGAQTLYAWLRRPGEVARRRALAERVAADDEARASAQTPLAALGDRVGWDAVSLASRPLAPLPLPAWAYRAAVVGGLVFSVLALVLPSLLTILLAVASVALNAILHLRASSRIDGAMGSLRELASVVSTARLAHAALDDEARDVFQVGDAIRRASAVMAKGGVALRTPPGGDSYAEIPLEYARIFLLLDVRAYLRTAKALEAERGAVLDALRFLGELDAALSLAHLVRHDAGLCAATAISGPPRLEARALAHPLLDGAVANDASLGPRGLLVTGSNMAGKSTFLRTLGVNALLAQTLGVARAQALRMTPLRVFASMGADDDLHASVSLYQAEVLRVRELLRASYDAPCLFLLDELFRGTNPRDRVAASSAVLVELARGHLVIAATHDLAVADFTEGAFALGHFSEEVDAERVTFDYRLRPGLSRGANALALLSRFGFGAELVARAQRIASLQARDDAA